MLRKDTVFKLGIRSYTFLVSDPILGKYWAPFISLDWYVKSSIYFLTDLLNNWQTRTKVNTEIFIGKKMVMKGLY